MTSNKTEFDFESMFRDMNLVWGQRRKWDKDDIIAAVSYTHLTLPTNREV